MTPEWKAILRQIYNECRWERGWPDLYELHDPEDQAYFLRLEENAELGYSIGRA